MKSYSEKKNKRKSLNPRLFQLGNNDRRKKKRDKKKSIMLSTEFIHHHHFIKAKTVQHIHKKKNNKYAFTSGLLFFLSS